jgi:hypothetical protein
MLAVLLTISLYIGTASNSTIDVRSLIYAQGPTDPQGQGEKDTLIKGAI